MKKITQISQFKINTEVQGFYLCKEKSVRTTRAGEYYLDLTLIDKTGEVSAKVWNRAVEFSKKFEKGDPLVIRGKVESYQDKLQLVIGRINKATTSRYSRYGYREEDLIPTSPFDPEKMWEEIGRILQGMKDPFLKKLVSLLYRKNKKTLMRIPASISRHYPFRSGYLEHVLSLSKAGKQLAKQYKADEDILLAGILLHGIGKVKEYNDSLIPSFSDDGNFVGHIGLGREMIHNTAAQIADFPKTLLRILDHLIDSHEGAYDGRYSVKPKIKESLLLQQLDYLDMKINVLDRIIDEDPEEGDWTNRRNFLGTVLYKGEKR